MYNRVAAFTALLLASAANAADSPLYHAPDSWVEMADLAAVAPKASGPVLIQDMQVRAAGDTVTTYTDYAIRLDSPQALTQLGTLTAQWMPDKGDLVVHRAVLVRDGAEIDLLKDAKFTVLRREQQLEQRSLDGMLTATMPVAGARLGDILRLTYSVSVADKALGGQVQDRNVIGYQPFKPGLGRLRISWPESQAVRVSAGPRMTLPEITTRGGFKQVDIPLSRPKPDEMPNDAPARFRNPPVAELTSFADWQQVSRTMAPLFATDDAIAANGPIAAEVAKIAAASNDPMQRAAAALGLVQTRIAYLAEGMNGGNYTPQPPETTWQTRYGDCKAKTLLLNAMLRKLGIDAEPILVSSDRGDGIFEGLPMPGAFDHVMVHATVAGKDLWLDGTGLGASVAGLEDAPAFGWGLPLRTDGAALLQLPNRAPAVRTMSLVDTIDMSAGVDFPGLYDVTVQIAGPYGAALEQASKMPASKERDQMIDMMVSSFMGPGGTYERDLSFDPATGITTVKAKGMMGSIFDRSEKRAEYAPRLLAGTLQFEGNRSRAAWREIPVALPSPDRQRSDVTVILPALEGYSVEGATLHTAAAGAQVDRDAQLTGNRLHIVEEVATSGGELAPANIAAERARYTALAANSLRVKAPVDAPRSWDMRGPYSKPIKAIEEAYGKLIAANADENGFLIGRASFYVGLRDYKRAIADLDKAIAIDPSADIYAQRAAAKEALGDVAGAATDLASAAELEPSGDRVAAQARLMGRAGKSDDALALINGALGDAGDAKPDLVQVKAELLARSGRTDEGSAALADLAADRPGDATLLNAQCWYDGIWNHAMDRAAADCEAAVNAGNFAPAVLDSRALVNFRLGKLESALADANAVLGKASGQDQTLLLRGIIRTRMGDAGGRADIAEALRRQPGLEAEYTEYGLLPAK